MKNSPLPPQCAGCVKIRPGGTCAAIKEPRFFWRKYGACFGYQPDPNWWNRYRRALEQYRLAAGGK